MIENSIKSKILNSPSYKGVTSEQASERLEVEGYNELPSPEKRGFHRIIFEILLQPMFSLLLLAGLIYLLLGDKVEALFLLLFACFSVLITIIQESRSEKVLQSLRDLASPRATVIRDGITCLVSGREVVREDLLIISEGDRIPADALVISAHDLLMDESLLTGESMPTLKQVSNTLINDHFEAIDKNSKIFAGSLAVRGNGRAVVYSTGLNTEMGKIGHALKNIETEQPHLQKQMKWFVRDFAIIAAMAAVTSIIVTGLFRSTWIEAFLGGIAIGMSLLPEELPLVLAVFMAMGAWRISRAGVLTRKASAIETLGATTVLCTDKTGTLTENKMTVSALVSESESWIAADAKPLTAETNNILFGALFASAIDQKDPMDIAIQALASSNSHITQKLEPDQLVRTYGIRPDLLAVTNVIKTTSAIKFEAYAKGAIEAILNLTGISAERADRIRLQADELSRKGIRVLGVAKASNLNITGGASLPDTPKQFQFDFWGLIGFSDPLRTSVPAAISECHAAGVRVVMITGDYPITAQSIGIQAGIVKSQVLSGDDIDGLTEAELKNLIGQISIFARITPLQKLRIIESLKANGEIVAMTGDGVNDAPALKAAHIGIAMGGRGTDVAREASALVLIKDDFASIVKTISLGRRIYDNLLKAIEFIIAVHIPIAGLALFPLAWGIPLLLTPIHIAFLEMIIDPACSIIFEAENAERNIMKRPPRDPKLPLLQSKRIQWAVFQGALVFVMLASLLIWTTNSGMAENQVRALVFASLVTCNLCLILVNRSFESSLMHAVRNPNRSMWILISIVLGLLMISLFWQPMQILFHFGELTYLNLGISFATGVVILIVLEAVKNLWFKPGRSASNRNRQTYS